VRTIKLFAVIGLAVALVAVPALAEEIEIQVKCAGTPLAPQVDRAKVESRIGDTIKWTFVDNFRTCVSGVATIAITFPSTSPFAAPVQPISVPASGPVTAGPFRVEKTGTHPYKIEFKDARGNVITTIDGTNTVITATPTLTEWGLIALAVLLAGGMGYMIYRRRPALRPAAP
jgi:hypothetical protein